MTVTRELAGLVADHPAEVSGLASVQVRRAVLDLLGVMLAGSREPAARQVLDYARAQGTGDVTVVGSSVRLAAPLAALVNGTAGHALDYDDIGLDAGHVSTAMVPAALATAEAVDAGGAELITALTLGYEVTHRLTRVVPDNLSGPYAYGYHKPSVYAVFGATAAAARLLRLDASTVAHAFGIAASQAGGLRVNFGTMTKPMHAGNSNRSGVEAAQLAAAGFTASPEALEGRYGWHEVLCRGAGPLDRVVAGLGDPPAIERGMIYKVYPCCGANHYAIDGVLHLMDTEDLKASDVLDLSVAVHAPYLRDVLIYPWPRTGLEGKFSLAYCVAAALADGAVGLSTFTDDHLQRLEPFRERVTVTGDPELDPTTARVVLRTTDGRELRYTHRTLRGSLETPLAWDDIAAKFLANCAGAHGADDALARIADLDEQPSVRPILEALR